MYSRILSMLFTLFRMQSYESEGPNTNLYEEKSGFERQNASDEKTKVETLFQTWVHTQWRPIAFLHFSLSNSDFSQWKLYECKIYSNHEFRMMKMMQIYRLRMILNMFPTTNGDGYLTKKTRSRNTGLDYVFQVIDWISCANPWPLEAFPIADLENQNAPSSPFF